MQSGLIDPRLITVGVVILIIILIGIALYVQRRRKRTSELRQRFGAEYERTVREHGSVNKAQTKLEDREARVGRLNIRALGATERERFVADWQSVQSHFVDRPKNAVTEADQLVSSLMQARGYPLSDSISGRRTSRSTILGSWKTTAPRTRSPCALAATARARKTCVLRCCNTGPFSMNSSRQRRQEKFSRWHDPE